MNDFYRVFDKLKEEKKKIFALATIVRVEGSSYRREGAKILIQEDGTYYGTISAGCLEEDLVHKAKEVIRSFNPAIIQYDLRSEDDLSWGQSAGCDGYIEVYIEPLGWELNRLERDILLWPYIDKQLKNHRNLISVKCMNDENSRGPIMLFSTDGKVLGGSLGPEAEEHILTPYIHQFSIAQDKVKLNYIEQLQASYLFEFYQSKDQLVIFGAGPDAEPIAELASKLDFSITVVDPRESRCNEKYFPKADFLICEHPDSFFCHSQVPCDSYVIVMTHNFNRDQKILNYLLKSPPQYLGVLGPMRRTARLVDDKAALSFIHSPIGLNIGAEGPEEISISVLAEIVKIRNQSFSKMKSQQIEYST